VGRAAPVLSRHDCLVCLGAPGERSLSGHGDSGGAVVVGGKARRRKGKGGGSPGATGEGARPATSGRGGWRHS
jgi:hypothetical protein